jgi:hypothetical protein
MFEKIFFYCQNIKNNFIITSKLGLGISLSIFLCVGIVCYRNYCNYYTWINIDKNYKKLTDWENELQIYSISMPRCYTSAKKKRCILLIGGYKDIPYVWNEIEKYFIQDNMDFYAPRTYGNGRSFYQCVSWKDWVITYMEAMFILQEQYDSVDIIGFSTGCVVALYISQYNFKCKINNILLCAPFLLPKKLFTIELLFSSNWYSYLLNRILAYTLRFHPKSKGNFSGYRDTYNDFYSSNDYCEIFGDIQMENVLFDFIKFRPKQILANNLVILYPNHDDIIGNIYEQHKIISNIFTKKHIEIISIPSYLNKLDNISTLPIKSGHVMFKEHPEIIKDLYLNFKKYL